jgi:NAD(P)-dependent dehydrogenase (short-subunit alcohol dehydrogenase family)
MEANGKEVSYLFGGRSAQFKDLLANATLRMDVAGSVVFLASPAASLITGHTLLIDGGWTAR